MGLRRRDRSERRLARKGIDRRRWTATPAPRASLCLLLRRSSGARLRGNGKLYRQSLDYTTEDGTPIYRERAWEIATDETEDARIRIDYLRVVALAGDGGAFDGNQILLEDLSGPILSEDGQSPAVTEDSAPINAPLGDQMLEDGSGPVMLEDGSGPLLLEGNPQDPLEPLMWLQISRDGGRNFGYERFQKLGRIGERRAQARWRRLGIGRATVLRVATNMTGRVSWTEPS